MLEEQQRQQQDVVKQLEQRLSELELKPLPNFEPLPPQLDLTTTSISKATVMGSQISCDRGINEYHPFFLSKRLEGKASFQIEIVTPGDYVYIGIAADTLRNTTSINGNPDSLVLQLNKGSTHIHSEGKQWGMPPMPQAPGSRVLVTYNQETHMVEWRVTSPFLFGTRGVKASIPNGLRTKTLLAVVQTYCSTNAVIRLV